MRIDRQQQFQEIGSASIRYHRRQLALDKLEFRGDPVHQPVNLDSLSPGALPFTGTPIETGHPQVHSAKETLETDGVIIFERSPCPTFYPATSTS